MWILPKNYPLSSHFAQDMVASKEDLTLPALSIESSLLAKSKPTRLRTWQTRWKEGSYYPHLFGRILKPCQWSLFEEKLTSLLAAIHVNHSVQQESDLERKTQDTCGLTSGDTLNQLDLFGVSLKTSKGTLASDLEKSLATWKASVIKQTGEYSQRVKLALLTKEKESTSWPTPSTRDYKGGISPERTHQKLLEGKRAHMGALDNRVAYQIWTETGKKCGHLNPDWVEWLMGVPIGWTELGSWETELFHKQQQKHGSRSTKDSRH